jgi:hypothetical protein
VLTYVGISNWEEKAGTAWGVIHWWVFSVDWHLDFAWLKGTRTVGFNFDVEREFGLRHAVLNELRQLLRFAECTRVYLRYDAHLFLETRVKLLRITALLLLFFLVTVWGKRMAWPSNIYQFSSYLTVNTLLPCYQRWTGSCCLGKQSLFIVRTVRNSYILWTESRVLWCCVHDTRGCFPRIKRPGLEADLTI